MKCMQEFLKYEAQSDLEGISGILFIAASNIFLSTAFPTKNNQVFFPEILTLMPEKYWLNSKRRTQFYCTFKTVTIIL